MALCVKWCIVWLFVAFTVPTNGSIWEWFVTVNLTLIDSTSELFSCCSDAPSNYNLVAQKSNLVCSLGTLLHEWTYQCSNVEKLIENRRFNGFVHNCTIRLINWDEELNIFCFIGFFFSRILEFESFVSSRPHSSKNRVKKKQFRIYIEFGIITWD